MEINLEDDSKKTMNKKPKIYILNLFNLNVGSVFDFRMNKRETIIKKEV